MLLRLTTVGAVINVTNKRTIDLTNEPRYRSKLVANRQRLTASR